MFNLYDVVKPIYRKPSLSALTKHLACLSWWWGCTRARRLTRLDQTPQDRTTPTSIGKDQKLQKAHRLLTHARLGVVQCSQKPNSWTYNFIEVSGHNIETPTTFSGGGGGGGPFLEVTVVSTRGKTLLRLSSQLRPRIRPLVYSSRYIIVAYER